MTNIAMFRESLPGPGVDRSGSTDSSDTPDSSGSSSGFGSSSRSGSSSGPGSASRSSTGSGGRSESYSYSDSSGRSPRRSRSGSSSCSSSSSSSSSQSQAWYLPSASNSSGSGSSVDAQVRRAQRSAHSFRELGLRKSHRHTLRQFDGTAGQLWTAALDGKGKAAKAVEGGSCVTAWSGARSEAKRAVGAFMAAAEGRMAYVFRGSLGAVLLSETGALVESGHTGPSPHLKARCETLHKLGAHLVEDAANTLLEEADDQTCQRLLDSVLADWEQLAGAPAPKELRLRAKAATSESTSDSSDSDTDSGSDSDSTVGPSLAASTKRSGRLLSVGLTAMLAYPKDHNDVRLVLVAPDGTEARLQLPVNVRMRKPRLHRWTVNTDDLGTLLDRQVHGTWRLRVEGPGADKVRLTKWELKGECSASRTSETLDADARRQFYAGAGKLFERLAIRKAGSKKLRKEALNAWIDLTKECPYREVREHLAVAMQRKLGLPNSPVGAAEKRFNSEILPLFAPKSPDYDYIFRDGKRTINAVLTFGDETDDALYRGGMRFLERKGFVEDETGRRKGVRKFVLDLRRKKKGERRKENGANISTKYCDQVVVEVQKDDGINAFAAVGREDVDMVLYQGHSKHGDTIDMARRGMPEQQGAKIGGAWMCATKDRAHWLKELSPDAQWIITNKPAYFWTNKFEGKRTLVDSEDLCVFMELLYAMSRRDNWEPIHKAMAKQTRHPDHAANDNINNYIVSDQVRTFHSRMDLDGDGKADYHDSYWWGRPVYVPVDAEASFEPRRPPGKHLTRRPMAGRFLPTAAGSAATMGHYDALMRPFFNKNEVYAGGFVDLGKHGPMARVLKRDTHWEVQFNSWYAHASEEALRAEANHAIYMAVTREQGCWSKRPPPHIQLGAIFYALHSIDSDIDPSDEPLWGNFLKAHRYKPLDYDAAVKAMEALGDAVSRYEKPRKRFDAMGDLSDSDIEDYYKGLKSHRLGDDPIVDPRLGRRLRRSRRSHRSHRSRRSHRRTGS